MKVKFLIAPFLLLVRQYCFANPFDQPASCPAIQAIKQVGVDFVGEQSEGRLAFTNDNKFGTEESWIFMFGFFTEEDDTALLKSANAAIDNLQLTYGPIPSSTLPAWVCEYQSQTNPEIRATAISLDFSEIK